MFFAISVCLSRSFAMVIHSCPVIAALSRFHFHFVKSLVLLAKQQSFGDVRICNRKDA